MIHYNSLLYKIKYLIYTEDYFYPIKPEVVLNVLWKLCGYSDADYAGDTETCKSVTVYAVIFNGVVITYNFRSQKTVTLYVREVEYSTRT